MLALSHETMPHSGCVPRLAAKMRSHPPVAFPDTARGGGSAYSVAESMTPVLYHTPGLKQQGGILQSISCEILDLQDATYPGAK